MHVACHSSSPFDLVKVAPTMLAFCASLAHQVQLAFGLRMRRLESPALSEAKAMNLEEAKS